MHHRLGRPQDIKTTQLICCHSPGGLYVFNYFSRLFMGMRNKGRWLSFLPGRHPLFFSFSSTGEFCVLTTLWGLLLECADICFAIRLVHGFVPIFNNLCHI